MEVSIVYCQNVTDEKKKKMKKIIKDSFEQISQRKPVYIRNQLKKKYEEEWNVIFISPIDEEFNYSFAVKGSFLCCLYQSRLILIENQSKIESGNDSFSEIENIVEKFKAQVTIGKNQEKIEKLKSKINEETSKVESLKKIIEENEKEINYLKDIIKENKFNQTFYSRGEILALNFVSSEGNLHFAVPCVKKDLFVDVEKKLYEKHSSYRETNNTFLVQGKAILRFKTIEENKLESGIPIIVARSKNI